MKRVLLLRAAVSLCFAALAPRAEERPPAAWQAEVQVPKIAAALDSVTQRLRDQEESELRLFGIRDAAASYADGKRSILEIRDSVAAGGEPIPIETLELYFRAFEKAAVMKILEKQRLDDRTGAAVSRATGCIRRATASP